MVRQKQISLKKGILLMAMSLVICGGCGWRAQRTSGAEEVIETADETVVLEVVTTFAGNDGGAQDYQDACRAWAEQNGVTLVDMSSISDETFKTRVTIDFETGSEPDVLFFFNGADANNFIEAGKVVSLDEIRESYPDFGSNLDIDKIPVSLVDGKVYAIPVNGYWEALFVNRAVLENAGVEMPGEDYTWEQFMRDCEKLKGAGYIPIAASLGNIPHYWWEYAIFNRTAARNHQMIPESADEVLGQIWVQSMEDIKELYDLGYFPWNTNYATDEQTFSLFMNDKAAFLLDGSWKVGSIVQACRSNPNDPNSLDEARLEQFDIAYVPTRGSRKATDLIGGMSMGYYITRNAWEDPATRDAAVSFVSYMTSDEVAPKFAGYTASVLKNMPAPDEEEYNSLQMKAMKLMSHCTSLTGAVQDLFLGEGREVIFDGIPDIVRGKESAYDVVSEGLTIYNGR